MLKRTPAIGLTLAMAVMLASCGGSKSPPAAPKGSILVLISDLPLCNTISFTATISNLTLSTASGAQVGHVLTTGADYGVNLSTLRDFTTVLALNSIPQTTYNEATLTISTATIALYDPNQNPPVTTMNAKLSSRPPTFDFVPVFPVTTGIVNALMLDFDMVKSIQLDANNNVTGNVTPVFSLTPLTATNSSEGFGEMDDLLGFVRSVSPTPSPSTPQFTGSFLMQISSDWLPSGPSLPVNFTSSTQLYGVAELNQVLTDDFVEVDGFMNSTGNLVANSVEVEPQENPSLNEIAMIGLVTSVSRDPNGNLSGFNLWVRQEEPSDTGSVPLNSILSVSVSSSTTYQYSSRGANFAGLVFGPGQIAPGQELVVHGPFTVPPTGAGAPYVPTTVAASAVYLKLQSFQGSFDSSVEVGSDDRTGAFWLSPCCPLFQPSPVLVLSSSQTNFVNLSGLSALTPGPALLVKGLPFYEPEGGTINGVTVPPGTLVMLAKQVHQL